MNQVKTGRVKRTVTPGNLLAALVAFLFLVCLSVSLVLNMRALYYFDIDYLQLESTTGYSREVIRENYDALIDYNLFTKGINKLEFPSLPMSDEAEIHFKEVKDIFVGMQICCVVSGLVMIIAFWRKFRKRDFGSLRLTGILCFLIPIVLGIGIAVNWEALFIGFHKLVFNNDYWLFDPVTDPIITMLPDAYFAQCAVAILLILFLGGILAEIFCHVLTKRYRIRKRGQKG